MGDSPKKPSAWSQFLVPSFVATVLTLAVNGGVAYFGEVGKQREATQQFNASFTQILTQDILDKTHALATSGTLEDEQAASVALFAMDGLADSEAERRTVLLVGARLLNASPREDTGGPAARYLDIAIKQLEEQQQRGPNRAQAQDLLDMIRSPGFVDLIAAGYSRQYFNDVLDHDSLIRPTILGDQMITQEDKLDLLQAVTPADQSGWIHVATWSTDAALNTSRPLDYGAMRDALLDPAGGHVRKMVYGYADPTRAFAAWLHASAQPQFFRLEVARLLRDGAPQVYAVSENQLAGTLGRVIGALGPSTCVQVLEPARPVLVYFKQPYYATSDRTARGRFHVWVHVRAVSDDQCAHHA
jgi:hypothetical protein